MHPTIVGQNVRSCILLNGIDPPPINYRWNARKLAMLLEVEERVNAELQVASDEVPGFASAPQISLSQSEYASTPQSMTETPSEANTTLPETL
jgi:hypothetical protein